MINYFLILLSNCQCIYWKTYIHRFKHLVLRSADIIASLPQSKPPTKLKLVKNVKHLQPPWRANKKTNHLFTFMSLYRERVTERVVPDVELRRSSTVSEFTPELEWGNSSLNWGLFWLPLTFISDAANTIYHCEDSLSGELPEKKGFLSADWILSFVQLIEACRYESNFNC